VEFLTDSWGGSALSRSRSAVLAAATAALAVVPVAGCSLVESNRAATELPSSLPAATAATAGVSTSAAVSTSASPGPVAAPTPPPVTGYRLTASPPTVVRKFDTVAGKFNGVFGGLTVRNVTKGSDAAGTVVLLGLQPQLVGNANVERGLLPGVVKGMSGQGAKTSSQKVGTVDVAVASTKTTNIVAWYAKGTVVLVLGSGVNPAPSLAFAKAYLTAAGA
jgi:hypothetical protein